MDHNCHQLDRSVLLIDRGSPHQLNGEKNASLSESLLHLMIHPVYDIRREIEIEEDDNCY